MAGISKVILVGNLGRDPEVRYTPNGTLNVQFSMAVSRQFRDQSGQQQEKTNWFRVTAWGKLAEILVNLSESGALRKGRQVFVEGRLDSREYQDQNGQTRTSLDVNASEFQLLGSRSDFESGQGGEAGFGDAGEAGGFGGARQRAAAPAGGRPGDGDDADNLDDVPF